MKPTTTRALWISGLAATALAAVGATLALTGKAAAAPTPPGPAPQAVSTTLTNGHQYTVTFVCPSSTSQPQISGITGINLVSTTPTTNGGVIVFDYTGATGSYPITTSGCTITVTDNGPSPAAPVGTPGGPAPTPVPHNIFNLAQNQIVQAAGVYSAHALVNGVLNVTVPGNISGVDASPAVKSWTVGTQQNVVGVVLTGTAGLVTVRWNSPTPPNSASAAINVS